MAEINLETVAYILGIISIVLAFFSPLAGLILGIIGLVQSNKLKNQKAKKLNVIGIVLSIIFLIIAVALVVLSINAGAGTGSFPIF